jgi:hypothetical protein
MTNQERYENDLKIILEGGSKAYVIDGFNACIRRRGYIGHLCGYVEVPDGLDIDIDEIYCHGGITFNDCWDELPTDGHYIGFDCMHFGDWDPLLASNGWSFVSHTYKDTEFVLNEIKSIIKQLKEKQHENF